MKNYELLMKLFFSKFLASILFTQNNAKFFVGVFLKTTEIFTKIFNFWTKNVILEVEGGMIWSIFPIELWFRDMLVHHVTPCDKSRNKCYDFRADAGTQFLSRMNLIFRHFQSLSKILTGLRIRYFVMKFVFRHVYRTNIWYRRCFTGGFNT